jgi:acyl dehydratase
MTGRTGGGTIAPGIVGAEVGPLTHEIDARWLMAYAAALGETDPRYVDTRPAGGPLAHPLFAVCYEWPAALALRDLTLAAVVQPYGVHATHHLVIHRPPRAGDALRTTARVIAVRPQRSGTLVVSRFETTDAAGDRVTTTDYGSLYRGVALDGVPDTKPDDARRPPGGEAGARWIELVDIGPHAARVYTECARIYNPIHTDLAVARAAGLAAPILHGTATLALAVSRVVSRDLHGQPLVVAEVSARFTAMVPMPATLRVRGGDRVDDHVGFDVVNDAGVPVLAAGRIRLAPSGSAPAKEL